LTGWSVDTDRLRLGRPGPPARSSRGGPGPGRAR